MLSLFLIKNIAEEFNFICENPTIGVSVKGFFMEAGFEHDSGAEGKRDFYEGVVKFTNCLQKIAKELNEDIAYVGTFIKHEKNYYNWKDVKKFDACNELRSVLKSKETKEINVNNNYIVDLIIECNFRYFSQVMFYFPKSKIFIRPDVHCWFEVYGKTEQLNKLYDFLERYNDGSYLISQNQSGDS